MNLLDQFEQERKENIRQLGEHPGLWDSACNIMREMGKHHYTYNFSWMGSPIIQLPQDILALVEWKAIPRDFSFLSRTRFAAFPGGVQRPRRRFSAGILPR